jgi:glycerophosphoryl diester phosphodiesterase
VVVLHDTDLLRVAGDRRKVWEISGAELRRLDAGRHFGPEFAGERIPTLEEVSDAAGDRIRLNIELKFNGHERQLVGRVLEILTRKDFESRCVITSLSAKGLREVRRRNPRVKVGYIVFKSLGDLSRLDGDFLSVRAERRACCITFSSSARVLPGSAISSTLRAAREASRRVRFSTRLPPAGGAAKVSWPAPKRKRRP